MRTIIASVLAIACATAFAAPAPDAQKDVHHTVVAGDTLWDLAERYYGDHYKWRKIADRNPPPSVQDPHWIYPGQVLVIPGEDSTQAEQAPAQAPDIEEGAGEPGLSEPASAEQAPPQEPANYAPAQAGGSAIHDSLSTTFPEGMTGHGLSVSRMAMPKGWAPKGKVLESDDGATVAAQGDRINVRIAGEIPKGRRYIAYRRSAPTEADEDKSADYVERIGLVEILGKVSKDEYRAVVVRSSGAIEAGDLLDTGD